MQWEHFSVLCSLCDTGAIQLSYVTDGIRALFFLQICFYRTYKFADEHTRTAFEQQSASIRDRNRNRDAHMSYHEVRNIHQETYPCIHIYIDSETPLQRPPLKGIQTGYYRGVAFIEGYIW